MTKKCSKFESLFIFSDDDTLQKHISECDDCKCAYDEMNKVSELIQEVRPYYLEKQKTKYNAVRVACIMFAFIISGVTFHFADMNYGIIDTITYGSQLTADDLGFRTDDYGLIMVDD